MADDETPENETEETGAPAVEAPPEPEAEVEAPAEEAAPAAPKLSAKEQRTADEHKAKSQRPSRTAEERNAERRELRRKKAVARTRRRQQEKAKRGTPGVGTPPAEPKVSTPQVRQGTVVSSKADKTITVRIDTARRHRRYGKVVRSTSTLHAHDESNDAGEGDRVSVVESRPLSRSKRWKLVEVLERAK
jgi:small subunit ribosomal protein S17